MGNTKLFESHIAIVSQNATHLAISWPHSHLSCQWASVSFGLRCNLDLSPALCSLSRGHFASPAVLRHRRRCTVRDTQAASMSFFVVLIALIPVRSEPSFLACCKMQWGACTCSCGTRTRSLSAIVLLPCWKRLRHEHNTVLMSQAGLSLYGFPGRGL